VVSWEVEVVWRRCKAVVVTTKPGFMEAFRAFESMRAFMCAHDITERDQANIVNIESLLFKLKRKGATKQMTINDFLKKK
jgi:2-keto-4-pentenoate hydratase/2-oxohepta-3-ene-1,7-dioic acid hydratase in catechol pathway